MSHWFDDLSFHDDLFDGPYDFSNEDALTHLYGHTPLDTSTPQLDDFVYSYRLNNKALEPPRPSINPLFLHDASLLPDPTLLDDSFLPAGSCTIFTPSEPLFSPSLALLDDCPFPPPSPQRRPRSFPLDLTTTSSSSSSSSSSYSSSPLSSTPSSTPSSTSSSPIPIAIKQDPSSSSSYPLPTACSFPPAESTSVPRRMRTNSTGGPSYKVASRIKALELLFSSQLPSFCPSFLPSDTWARLQAMCQSGTLVQFNAITATSICVTIPEEYDLTIHSRANYGEELKEFTASTKTRFRWWSDAALVELKPIKNRADPPGMIQRTVTLPEPLVRHPLVEELVERQQYARLFRLLSRFFNHLLHGYLHTEDRSVLDADGFGRSRKKPRPTPHVHIPFNTMVETFLVKIESILFSLA